MDTENFKVGTEKFIEKKITKELVLLYAELSGDNNPLHVDEIYAASTELKTPVAHGMLLNSFVSQLIGMELPGKGALWLSQTVNFEAPVRYGDNIKIKGKITHITQGGNLLTLQIEAINQNKTRVLSGTANVKLLKKK